MLQNVALFFNTINNAFGIPSNTVECYRALYLYKCRKYNEVQYLCELILQKPDLSGNMSGPLSLENVSVVSPLDSFFDEDIQCLIGVFILFCYLSRLHESDRISKRCISVSE